MKYYFINKANDFYQRFGSSGAGLKRKTRDIQFDKMGYLDYPEPIVLGVLGAERETKLIFPIIEDLETYLLTMIPALKYIFSQFNMPEHRWYKAEVGYDLEFVKDMKKYFKIEYPDIDLKEKREYWILQFLNQRRSELAFDLITFKLNDYDTYEPIEGLLLGKTIKDFAEYKEVRKKEIKENSRYPEPSQYIYHKNYDILWGGTHIVFNEKVKAALEASNLINYENGLEFAEFTEYEIVMLGEQN